MTDANHSDQSAVTQIKIRVNYTNGLLLCQFIATLPLGVKVRCGNIVCGMVVCVNVEHVNLGPQPVGASDARGSSERLRRFMQRVALVRCNKQGWGGKVCAR